MPKTLGERLIFGLLMASFMVYGMEVYNSALIHRQINRSVLIIPFNEFCLLIAIVIIIQELLGAPLAKKLAFKITKPGPQSPIKTILAMQIMNVCIMCPAMSLVAVFIFKGVDIYILTKWLQTIAVNFPMALCWQLFIAGPLVRLIFKKLFAEPQNIVKNKI